MIDPLDYNSEDAFHGALGEYAKRSAEHMEIDHFTLYVHLLVVMGNMIGRRRACFGGDSLNYPNLFALVVADSAQGKGCVASRAERFAEHVDPEFRSRLHHDVQSAPALIRLIADEQSRLLKKGRNNASPMSRVVEIPGVADKRCLLSQGEMQSTFTAKGRSGSTLGPMLKLAWDGVTLENNTKDGSLRATAPHVSLVGSITPQELRQVIAASRIDLANGFFNRFLVVRPQTVRLLPRGGDRSVPRDLVDQLKAVLASLGTEAPPSQPEIIDFETAADSAWAPFYAACRDPGHPFLEGLAGFRERLAPNTMRVAMILATLAGKAAIGPDHLHAARATCLRCLDSVRGFIDGKDSLSLTPVSKIAAKLRRQFDGHRESFDKAAIWKALNNHGQAEYVNQAIDELLESNVWQRCSINGQDGYRLTVQTVDVSAGGHPAAAVPVLAKPACMTQATGGDEIVVDGHRVRLGAPLTVEYLITCYGLDERPRCVEVGTACFLAQQPFDAKPAEKDWLANLAAKMRACRLVITADGDLLFMPQNPAVSWADALSRQAPSDEADSQPSPSAVRTQATCGV